MNIGHKIIKLSHLIDRAVGRGVAKYGITNIQAKIINFVYFESQKREIFQKDIEERFEIRRSSVTSVLSLMESNGIIKRESVAEDGRLKKIVLQQKGVELHDAVFECIDEIEGRLSGAITEEERRLLFDLLDRLSEQFTE